jgi:hypothetical protein
MSQTYGDLFNNAAALFPIMVLTKAISFRSRAARDWERPVHLVHIGAVGLGEAAALLGAGWRSDDRRLALLVAALLAVAGITLGIDLWKAAHARIAGGGGPAAPDQVPMPPQQRARLHERHAGLVCGFEPKKASNFSSVSTSPTIFFTNAGV